MVVVIIILAVLVVLGLVTLGGVLIGVNALLAALAALAAGIRRGGDGDGTRDDDSR